MAISNEEILRAAMEAWTASRPGTMTVPDALRQLLANTSPDRSSAHIDNFIYEIDRALGKAGALDTYFDKGVTRDGVNRVVIEAIREVSTSPSARVITKYSETLSTVDRLPDIDSTLVLRIGHMEFLEAGLLRTEDRSLAPTVVPSSIMIRRSHLNKKIDTVRSPSSPVAVAQAPVEQISMDLIFPSLESVNIYLRELYSMVNMLPVMLIESPLLTKAYINQTDFPEIYNRSILQDISSVNSEVIDTVVGESLSTLENAIELSRTDDPFLDVIFDRVKKEAAAYVNPSQDVQPDAVINKVNTAIGVALRSMSIQTLPENAGAVMARLTFTRANVPMLEKGQPIYLDKNGNGTHTPANAPYLIKFANSLRDPEIAGDRYLEEIDRSIPGWDDFTLTWNNIYGQEKTIQLNSEGTVESNVNLTSGFKIAALNLVSTNSPLVQHMGRTNVEGMIVLETKDLDLVENLSTAKAEIREEAKNGFLRRNSADVVHPLLNMLGVKKISLTDIAIQQDQQNPELMTITLGVVENAFNITDVEELTLEEGAASGAIDVFWEFVRKLNTYGHRLAVRNPTQFQAWLNGMDSAEKYTWETVNRLLNGDGGDNPGILQYPGTGIVFDWVFNSPQHHVIRAGVSRLFWELYNGVTEYYSGDSSKDMGGDEFAETLDFVAEVITKLQASTEEFVSFDRYHRGIIDFSDAMITILDRIGYVVDDQKSSNFVRIRNQAIPRALWESMLFCIKRGEADKNRVPQWSEIAMRTSMAVLGALVESPNIKNLVSVKGYNNDELIVFGVRSHLNAFRSHDNLVNRNRAATNYTDMVLPTYFQLYGFATDNNANLLWEKASPTWADLGVRPPLTDENAFLNTKEAYDQPAHTLEDLVTPGTFFYKPRVKKHMEELLEENYTETADHFRSLGVSVRIPIDSSALLDTLDADNFGEVEEKALYEVITKSLEQSPPEGDPWSQAASEYKDSLKDDSTRAIDILTSDGMPVIMYTKNVDGVTRANSIIGKPRIFKSEDNGLYLDPQSPKDLGRLLNSSVHHSPDNTSNMDKSFPAVRIYLVEEDRSFRTLFDDIYAISAIESVSVHKHMKDADTAVIKLSNTSGYLSEDSFIPKDIDNRVDDEGEPFLSKFKVNYGTHIVVKMGYAGRPDDLQTVFTGSVAEIMGGDQITLVAQSFKTELFNEVGHFAEQHTWDNEERPHLRSVLNKVIEKNGDAPHLGRIITLRDAHSEEAGKLLDGMFGSSSNYDTKWWANPIKYAVYALGGRQVSDITRNIYYDSNTYYASEFAVPTMPTMDAIDECVKYMPNFIADVVPYGVDATLYVGDPAGQYKYREPTRTERELFDISAGDERRDLTGANVPRDDDVEAVFGELLGGGGFTKLLSAYNESKFKKAYNTEVEKVFDRNRSGKIETFARSVSLRVELDKNTSSRFQSEKDILGSVREMEKSFTGLHRKLFSFFFGFDPNTTLWPRGLQGRWIETSSALLSPWYDSKNTRFTNAYYNAIAYINDNADEQTRQTIETADVTAALNPELINKDVVGYLLPRLSGAEAIAREGSLDYGTYIIDFMYERAIYYRMFVEKFIDFMQSIPLAEFAKVQKPRSFGAEMPPGYKPFRDYHFISSEQDIIENNITASDSEMWTAVAIKAPSVVDADGFWRTLKSPIDSLRGMLDPDVSGNLVTLSNSQTYTLWPPATSIPGSKSKREGMTFRGRAPNATDILRVFHEPNALTGHAAANVLNTRLCEGMAKMYRGNIVIVGKSVKPHDVVHIRDGDTNIMGNFVVESVTHNFDPNFGWTSTIVPQALTFHNSHFAHLNASFWSGLWNVVTSDELSNVLLLLSIAALVASALATGGLTLGAIPLIGGALRAGATRFAGAVGSSRLAGAAARAGQLSRSGGTFAASLLPGAGGTTLLLGGQFALQAGDKLAGRALRDMTSAAIQQSIGGTKYPILVNTLVYQGRPYVAGFKPTEYDYDTTFWKNFSLMMEDLYVGAEEFFKSNPRGIDIDKAVKGILKNTRESDG